MSVVTLSDIETFIAHCKLSSQSAYENFKVLLTQLETPNSRREAIIFLNQLVQYVESNSAHQCHFQLLQHSMQDANNHPISLRLLQFPSTFLPESWSLTFYEGLIRYPLTDYHQKQIAELGCGIGWITIALALRYAPDKIYGLDINPKAVVCAKLNLYLNAFDDLGHPRNTVDGSPLFDKVDFFESNLFSHFDNTEAHEFDRIIGCIPQVLNPGSEVMDDSITESSSDEYLYSLSNYFAKQGSIEDQYGLGLVASAVEQSIPLLKHHGKLILNLAGRPGSQVIKKLMQKRGFKTQRVWQAQVEQAADTEIDTMVDIEANTSHRFEFYTSTNADAPIDATTAIRHLNSGRKIYHSVDVYQAELLLPEQAKTTLSPVD